jgi:hypothetical protein
MDNLCKTLTSKLQGNRHLWGSRNKLQDNIKADGLLDGYNMRV